MQNDRFAPQRDIYRRLRSGLENAPDVLEELLKTPGYPASAAASD